MGYMTYWVWWERPGLPHLNADKYGGRSCATMGTALTLLKEKVRAGYIVRIYTVKG